MLLSFVLFFPDTINTQVHEIIKTTPFELMFGQSPCTVIAPDTTIFWIMKETMIKQEESSSEDDQDRLDDVKQASSPARQEEGCSNGSIHDVDDDEIVSEVTVLTVIQHHRLCYLVSRLEDIVTIVMSFFKILDVTITTKQG